MLIRRTWLHGESRRRNTCHSQLSNETMLMTFMPVLLRFRKRCERKSYPRIPDPFNLFGFFYARQVPRCH